MTHHNLRFKTRIGKLLMRVNTGKFGLKEAGAIASVQLHHHLAPCGYSLSKHDVGLCKHNATIKFLP